MKRISLFALSLTLALTLGGCSSAEKTGDTPPKHNQQAATASEPAKAPALAPFPYTPGQLRDASKAGRIYRYKATAKGGAVSYFQMQFDAVTHADCTVTSFGCDAAGKQLGESGTATSTWEQLQAHASYPADRTAITSDTITVGAGTYDCMKYEIRSAKEPGVINYFWFAKDQPGAPVKFGTWRNGAVESFTELAFYRHAVEPAPQPGG